MEGAGPGEERSLTGSRRGAGRLYSRDPPRREDPAGRGRGSGGAEGRAGADRGGGVGDGSRSLGNRGREGTAGGRPGQGWGLKLGGADFSPKHSAARGPAR